MSYIEVVRVPYDEAMWADIRAKLDSFYLDCNGSRDSHRKSKEAFTVDFALSKM